MDTRPETGLGSDWVRPRFLRSRLTSQLLSRNTGSAATPSRGTGDICLPVARATEGKAAPVATILSPVDRDYPSRALGGFFMPPHCDCSIKEQLKNAPAQWESHGFVPPILFTRLCREFASRDVNNLCLPVCSLVIHRNQYGTALSRLTWDDFGRLFSTFGLIIDPSKHDFPSTTAHL